MKKNRLGWKWEWNTSRSSQDHFIVPSLWSTGVAIKLSIFAARQPIPIAWLYFFSSVLSCRFILLQFVLFLFSIGETNRIDDNCNLVNWIFLFFFYSLFLSLSLFSLFIFVQSTFFCFRFVRAQQSNETDVNDDDDGGDRVF